MSAQRLYFGVKNRENGRPEFPINVPMFQPNSKILFCPQGEIVLCLLLCPESFHWLGGFINWDLRGTSQ